MKQMNYEEFEQYVKENLKILLPEAYADFDIVIREVRRPGYSYHGLMLTGKEEGCGVIVDLDHYYQEYRKPVPISKIMLSIASMVQEHIPDVEFGDIQDYEKVRSRLFIRVMNRMWCWDYLSRVPYRAIEDLAVTSHILVTMNDGQVSSTPVTKDLLETYGVSEDQLFEDAVNNGMKLFPAEIRYMADVLEVNRDERAERIITNTHGINGAAALFYPGQMEDIARLVGGDYYAVPTSIHEMILVPAKEDISEAKMNQALQRTICDITDERDWLSDHIYFYDSEQHVFLSIGFTGDERRLS